MSPCYSALSGDKAREKSREGVQKFNYLQEENVLSLFVLGSCTTLPQLWWYAET